MTTRSDYRFTEDEVDYPGGVTLFVFTIETFGDDIDYFTEVKDWCDKSITALQVCYEKRIQMIYDIKAEQWAASGVLGERGEQHKIIVMTKIEADAVAFKLAFGGEQ